MKKSIRFSLGTLLLLLTVLVLAISHYTTSRQLAAIRDELIDYRFEYGHLVVEDNSRTHVLRYANQNNPWKWHANFPEGKSFHLKFGIGSAPKTGIPIATELQHVHSTMVTGTGENITLFFSIEEHGEESLKASIGCDGAQTIGAIIPKWYSTSTFNTSSIGYREPFSAAADDPFVIFRYTERKANSAGASPSEEKGVVVWAVPAN